MFWGGWSPRLTATDLGNWPQDVVNFLLSPDGYDRTEAEIGASRPADFIRNTALFTALSSRFNAVAPSVTGITEVGAAPLAVQGASPRSGLFAFDKFSSAPFLIDAIRHDVANNTPDANRRIFLVPRVQVHRLIVENNRITGIDLSSNGARETFQVPQGCAVVLANGTVESTRLALESFGIGSTAFGAPRVANLMAHLRSNIVVKIRRSALGLTGLPTELETVALIVRGGLMGRRFHHQVTAAAGPSDANLFSMVPDIDLLDQMIAAEDPNFVTITFRSIGEMEDQRVLTNIDPARSWIDLSQESDQWQTRRAYVNLAATTNDRNLWAAMDQTAFDLADALAGSPSNIQYLVGGTGTRPQPNPDGSGPWQDPLGSTHHEAGTLFMGLQGSSITDTNGKFHSVENAYAVGAAVFPTLGSANPSLTALSLARRTTAAVVASV